MSLGLLHAVLDSLHGLVGLEAIVGRDAFDTDLREADDVFRGHLAAKLIEKGFQATADLAQHTLPSLRLLDVPIDALFDENAFERIPVPLLLQLGELDLQFAFQQRLGRLGAGLEDVAHAEEVRLVIAGLGVADDDAGGWIELHLATREDVELLDDLVGLGTLREMDEDLDLVRRVIVHMLDLDLPLRIRREDRFDQRCGRHAEGQLRDREQILRALLDRRADLHFPATLAVIVFREICGAAGVEVGENAEVFPLKMIDRRPADVVEIVRQDLGREPDRDALRAFQQHDRELRRKRDWLLIAPVVTELPVGSLRVEEHVLREVRQARLDVTRRGRIVAREQIAVIPLRLDEPPALPDGHQRRTDRGVAVRMQLHRRADDICDLVKAPVVHVPQRVQHPPLHRLQTVINVRHRAVEDDVARVFEEPVAIANGERCLIVLHLAHSRRRRQLFNRGHRFRDWFPLSRLRRGRFGCGLLVRQRKLRLVVFFFGGLLLWHLAETGG